MIAWISFADTIRLLAVFSAGLAIYLAGWTTLRGWRSEHAVTKGHPRRKLYRHITVISFFHVWLMAGFIILITDHFGDSLRWYTPFGLVGYLGTIYALVMMIGYQNSRLYETVEEKGEVESAKRRLRR